MSHEIKCDVLLLLCDILYQELYITKESEILFEIRDYFNQLSIIAEKNHLYPILVQNCIIQGKLQILMYEIEKFQKTYTKGQQIAHKYGLIRLEKIISAEYDEQLDKIEIWHQLKGPRHGKIVLNRKLFISSKG